MIRARAIAVTFAIATIAALSCACRKKHADVKAVDEHEGEGTSSCWALPAYVDREITIGERCTLVVDHSVLVRAKGKLVVGAGSKLAFDKGASLFVDGGALVVRGREDAPVIFTSHAPSPSPGDWDGVRLNDVKGASIAWTTIEFAGGAPSPDAGTTATSTTTIEAPMEERAALVVYPGCRDVALDHLHVVHAAHGGASLRGADVLARLSSSAFEENGGVSLETVADQVAQLGGNTFGEPVRVFGVVTRSATWSADVPVVVAGTLTVGSSAGPTLTLSSGATLRFAHDAQLQVGASPTEPGTLLARKVTFTPEGESPKPGAWGGFDLTFSSVATKIESCIVDHAGAGPSPYAWMPPISGVSAPVVRLPRAGKVTIRDTTFHDDDAPAFSGPRDCDGYDATALHNASIGQPLCASPPPAVIAFDTSEEQKLEMLMFGGESESVLSGGMGVVGGVVPLDAGPQPDAAKD
jgi:hypothetical protein